MIFSKEVGEYSCHFCLRLGQIRQGWDELDGRLIVPIRLVGGPLHCGHDGHDALHYGHDDQDVLEGC